MKLAIVGSRTISDINLSDYITEKPDTIISGGARGIDTLAAEYARQNGIELIEYIPNYNKYGRSAPIIRNRQIIEACDKVLAIWDGQSHGTLNSINLAKKLGKKLVVIDSNYNEKIFVF